MKKGICTLLIFILSVNCYAQLNLQIDSAKKAIEISNLKDERFISSCLFIADKFMDSELYDSSQLWLNKIHEKLPSKGNTLNNYLVTTRQAEVYYYNNLQQLGFQESQRGLTIAKALNDSFLLADSYNFLGLFLMNIDSVTKAIEQFKNGISYLKQTPFPQKYMSFTKPHHLYGNIAEAYFKQKEFDSAFFYYAASIKKAKEINFERGVAVAYFGMADLYLAQMKFDSAEHFYQTAINISFISTDMDVALISYGGLASTYAERNLKNNATEALKKGFEILKQNPNLNRYYTLLFLNNAHKVNKKHNNTFAIIEVLEMKSKLEKENIVGQNTQMQTILNAGLDNEKKIFNLQLDEAQRKQQLANTRLLMALIVLAFSGVAFLLYRYLQKQKQQVHKIRQEISQDLHDDIGASLSSLQIYGAVAQSTFEKNPTKAMEMLQKIAIQSKQVMENMNDIVWSMNTNDANTISLEAKVKNYSVELLSNNNIDFNCSINAEVEKVLKNIAAKRNVLLIIRETFNNIAKYSKATSATLTLNVKNKNLVLIISDNGIGFNYEQRKAGNGMGNMQKRVEELHGIFKISTQPNNGTYIEITIPANSL